MFQKSYTSLPASHVNDFDTGESNSQENPPLLNDKPFGAFHMQACQPVAAIMIAVELLFKT